MMKEEIYFLHGLDSSGNGTKGRFFALNFPQVACPDFQGSLSERLYQLEELTKNQQQLVLVGSSFGGLMATCYAIAHPHKVVRLILMAPALNFAEYRPPPKKLSMLTFLIVGKHDTVTPPALVVPLAEGTFANLETRIEDDDHLLHKVFHYLKWQKLLTDQYEP